MEPHRLPVDAWMQANATRASDSVDSGWSRAIHHGPLTVDQALAKGLAAMLDEDEAELRRADPFAFVTAPRRPSLLQRLLRR